MNPWTILGIVAAWLLSLSAVGYWQNQAGHTAERVKWQARETTELVTANREIERLNNDARAEERRHAESISNIATGYERKIENEKHKTDVLIADLLAGSLVLHDPGRQGAGASETGPTLPAAGERDGEAGTGLSAEASRFLLEQAGRCDAIVEQLTACQAVVISDRL